MPRLLRFLSIFLLLSLPLQACSSAPAGIGGAKARALIGKGALLVDVRSHLEFRYWTPISGAVNIPYGDLETEMKRLDKARPIVVYSRTGSRSAKAQAALLAAGFDAHNLGGLADWER